MAKKNGARKFRLENHLILVPYIANKLGIKKISDVKGFADVPDGFGSDGRSYMFHRLMSQPGLQITEEKLREYDDNIKGHVERLGKNRGEALNWKYFQYLASLFTEIYLDEYFHDPMKLLDELTNYAVYVRKNLFAAHGRNDLRKLAYWMATGSGKTLIMHVNLWQIQAYNKGPHAIDFDNIILITPNEGLSKQHFDEMTLSGISSTIFHNQSRGYFSRDDKNIIKIIDIYKLKLPEDKKGKGVTLDVSVFGDKNLILVDEGHKGKNSEDRKWMRAREELAKNGFTFEYSATFGQVITGGTKKAEGADLLEYSKAIIFDYSYKYFHGDGYGKDFRLLNLKNFDESDRTTIMLANAISFYEQLLVFNELGDKARKYNIEKPLWIFLGSRVQEEKSDLLIVMKFFAELIENKNNWVDKGIKDLLAGKSGILVDDQDVFARRKPETVFPYLRKKGVSSKEVLDGIYSEILGIPPDSGKKLHLVDLKRNEGELGLKASNLTKYFGVINIGNKSEFRKLIDSSLPDVVVETDAMTTNSLFGAIEEKDSPINVLIGAKKFIEGWNCWRVSTMGLMNVGKSEGPQIIQLFGRGVRLKGKESTLKRSSHIEPPHPKFIEVLETLGIFGIHANYLNTFRDMLEMEEVKTYDMLEVPVIHIEPFPNDLKIPRLKPGAQFVTDCLFDGSEFNDVTANLNVLPKSFIMDSRKDEPIISTTDEGEPKLIEDKYLELLDWDYIYRDLMNYRANRGWFNISFSKEDMKKVLAEKRYNLYAKKSKVIPQDFVSFRELQNLVVTLLKNYLDKCYSTKKNGWEKDNMRLVKLDSKDDNFFDQYTVRIDESEEEMIKTAKDLTESEKVYTEESRSDPLPNAYFDKHLYQPLLAVPGKEDEIIISPQGLNKDERKFVEDLALYLKSNPLGADVQVYLLRNRTRGKGIGFFETNSFYPDFILWIQKGDKQRIIFVDPHGMVFGNPKEKLMLHEFLKNEFQPKMEDPNVLMDSYIISVTPFNIVKQKYRMYPQNRETCGEQIHMLFNEMPDYINHLFKLTFKTPWQ